MLITTPVVTANLLNPMALIILLAIVLIIFGPSRLPQLGKSLGKTMKAVREGAESGLDDDEDETAAKPKTAKAKAKAPADEDDEA